MKKTKTLIIGLAAMIGLLAFVGTSRALPTTPPTVNDILIGGCTSNYQLPYLEDGLFGVLITFSEELDAAGKAAIETAFDDASDKELTYRWLDNKLRVSYRGNYPATFDSDVVAANVTDLDGDTTSSMLLVDTQNGGISTSVTNGSEQIGSFPVDNLSNTSWRINTSTLDSASISIKSPAFSGLADETLSDETGWETAYNSGIEGADEEDDNSVEIPFGFNISFNKITYSSVFVGSNTYLTFGAGSDEYSDLSAKIPPLPGVHIGADDHSFQKVLYKLDNSTTMRIRYEGTNATEGTIGEPNIIYEAVFYKDQAYFDLYVGIHYGFLLNDIYIDENYTVEGDNDGYIWGQNAFSTIGDGLDAVNECGTVNVAAGEYEPVTINTKGVSLIGPETGVAASIIGNCDYAISVEETDVTISNFDLLQTDGGTIENDYCWSNPVVSVEDANFTTLSNNDIAGGYTGVALRYDSSNSTLRDNNIHDNEWGGIVVMNYGAQTISGNTIKNADYGISLGYGPESSAEYGLGGTVISDNTIQENGSGIFYQSGNQEETVMIGPDNDITGNDEGIYINGNAYNLKINGNQIFDNIAQQSALHIDGATTGLDASGNWWGDESGPYEETYNPEGLGDVITIADSDPENISNFVYFRPFCTDTDCNDLSSVEVSPETISDLFFNGGTIVPDLADGEGDVSVTSLTVNEETVIKVQVGDINNAVTLPRGTVITKTDGGDFDATDITAADIALNTLSGFATDETLLGAIQWGIPSLGLSFSEPITLYIYVGTDLSGQTLVIKRSTSANEGWTNDGIVDPGTCTVSEDGFCSFQTTKASYYSVLDDPDFGDTKEEAEVADIDSWKAYLYDKPGTSCVQRLKLTIKGKHFTKDAEVSIGGKEAFEVNKKSSKELTAKFCMEKLLKVKTDLKRTISVTNPDADAEKAKKKIDLGNLSYQLSADASGVQVASEDVKNIQSSLVKLGYLDAQYVTGFYGPITTAAVKKFQGDNGIEQTGTVGPLTRAKLAELTK